MNKIFFIISVLLLAGCETPPAQQTPESISPTDYQDCIQAAKSGNGAESEAKCGKVMEDTR